MARETKEQRLAREREAQAAYLVELKSTYQTRLMSLLERAQKTYMFELSVSNLKFVVTHREDEFAPVSLDLNWTSDSEDTLNDLTWRVELLEAELEKARKRELARQTALSKLTKEEREALGV